MNQTQFGVQAEEQDSPQNIAEHASSNGRKNIVNSPPLDKLKTMTKHMPLIERFFQKVDKSGNKKYPDCWIWDAGRTSKDYGAFSYYPDKPPIGAHVASHLFHIGEVPKGKIVRHRCDNPPCVNPEHLLLGTNSDNMKDMFARNRQGSSNRKRTHCRKGHEFTPENIVSKTDSDGTIQRNCRECIKISRKKNRANPEKREKILAYDREYQKQYRQRKQSHAR